MLLRLLLPIVAALMLAACQRDDGPTASDAAAADPVAEAASEPRPEPVQDEGGSKPVEPEFPTLKLPALDGATYDLAARRGKWVVVNFWATWCAPCLKEMPELSALDAMREHVEVVGLAYEDIAPDAMRAFLEKHPVVYPIVLLDVYDPPTDFASPRGLPMTYLIGPDGKVARKFLGPVTAIEIETAIAAAGGPEAAEA
jgi:thiol-disulfide isomerase/thioredoxin